MIKPKIFAGFLLYLLLSATAIPLFAQYPGQWVEDLFLVHIQDPFKPLSAFVDENSAVRKKIPNVADALDFPIPPEYRSTATKSYWHNGALYTLADGRRETNSETGKEFKRWILAKWQDDQWHLLGRYTTEVNEVLKIIPCDDDRFIAISRTDLTGGNGRDKTPFVRMSILEGEEELRIDAPIAHGMDDVDMSNPDIFSLACFSSIAMTDRYAVVLNTKTGLYWIFSLETASLKRAGKLFGKATPEWIAKGGNSAAILCVHPEKDETVLISAQPEEYIMKASDVNAEVNAMIKQKPMTLDEVREFRRERLQFVAHENQFVVWHRIHPEDGRVEKDVAPLGADHTKHGTYGQWRPMPDGSVKMGAPRYSEDGSEKPKQEGIIHLTWKPQ